MKLQAKYKHKRHGKKTTHPLTFSLYIGFYAGLLLGGLKMLLFAMRFTDIVPGFLLEPFFQHDFLVAWQGILLGYASFMLLSLAAALLYGLFLRKMKGPWPGLGYGIAWWGFLYLLIGPLTQMTPAITQLDVNSLVSDLCLFTIWGLFIGYSITMEFTAERLREPSGLATPVLK